MMCHKVFTGFKINTLASLDFDFLSNQLTIITNVNVTTRAPVLDSREQRPESRPYLERGKRTLFSKKFVCSIWLPVGGGAILLLGSLFDIALSFTFAFAVLLVFLSVTND